MEEVVIEKPKTYAEQLEKVQRVHYLLLKDLAEVRHREVKQVRVEVLGFLVVGRAQFFMEVAQWEICDCLDSQKSPLISVIDELLLLEMKESDVVLLSDPTRYLYVDFFLHNVLLYSSVFTILFHVHFLAEVYIGCLSYSSQPGCTV